MMKSKILGKINFNEKLLHQEMEKILSFELKEEYAEYTFGTWKTCVLWNGTGDKDDATFRGYQGAAQKTEFGRQLPYLNSVIEETFRTEHLKWVRVFLGYDGILMSHRDFVELDRQFTRLNLPVQTNPSCLHSEEDFVFHMRKGEIWYFDAASVHAACNLGKYKRLSICLDFEPNVTIEEMIRKSNCSLNDLTPTRIERAPLDETQLNVIYSLGWLLTESNYKEILRFLAGIHFYKDVNGAEFFNWMIEISKRSGNKKLLQKSIAFKKFCISERSIGEQFLL